MSTLQSGPQEPVLSAATVSLIAHLVVLVGGWLGYSLSDTSVQGWLVTLVGVGIALFTIGAHLIAAVHARGLVTPVGKAPPVLPTDLASWLARLPAIESSLSAVAADVAKLREGVSQPLTAYTAADLASLTGAVTGSGAGVTLSNAGSGILETQAADYDPGELIRTDQAAEVPSAHDDTSAGTAHTGMRAPTAQEGS